MLPSFLTYSSTNRIAKPQRNITHVTDYSVLVYPTKMLTGKARFRKGKSFVEQFINPNAFCSLLDENNPRHAFTVEQYHRAWEDAVDQIWYEAKIDMEYFYNLHRGASVWIHEWEFEAAKHVVIKLVSSHRRYQSEERILLT
jgi:hypothetical protein